MNSRIVNHVCRRQELEPFTMRLAHHIAQTSPLVNSVLNEEIRTLDGDTP